MKSETIIAPATPEGRSAIAVVRMSGSDTFYYLSRLFRPVRSVEISKIPGNRIIYGYLEKDNKVIDEVMVAIFRSPHSYTREDMAEIYCHGNPLIVREVINAFESLGVRVAERGEFTLRAFLNGRIDLTQAEAVMSVISATNKIGIEVGLNQLLGGLRKELTELRSKLLELFAEVEARINFPDDVNEDFNGEEIIEILESMIDKISRMLDGAQMYEGIEAGIKVAIAGYPNVGKSSLFNAILKEERAIVYDLEGTTRDVITERIVLSDLTVVLMDTAGIMDMVDGIDKLAVERTRKFIDLAWAVILVLEAGRDLNEIERKLLRELKHMGKEIVVFVNKMDRVKEWSLEQDLGVPVVYGSSWDENSVSRLLNELQNLLDKIRSKKDEMYVLRGFQREELTRVRNALVKAKDYLLCGERLELVGGQFQIAMEGLDRIEGKSFDEELLSNIFREFCIGK